MCVFNYSFLCIPLVVVLISLGVWANEASAPLKTPNQILIDEYLKNDQTYNESRYLSEIPEEFLIDKIQSNLVVKPDEYTEIRVSKYLPKNYEFLVSMENSKVLAATLFLNPSSQEHKYVYPYEKLFTSLVLPNLPKLETHRLVSNTVNGSGFSARRRAQGKQTDLLRIENPKYPDLFVKHIGHSTYADLGFQINEYIFELFEAMGNPVEFEVVPEFMHISRKGAQTTYRSSLNITNRKSTELVLPFHAVKAWLQRPDEYRKELFKNLKTIKTKKWVNEYWQPLFLKALVEANIKYGLYPNAHSQNTLVVIDKKSGKPIKVIFRDLQDFSLDFSVLSIHGLNIDVSPLIERKINRIGYQSLSVEESLLSRDAGHRNFAYSSPSASLKSDIVKFNQKYINFVKLYLISEADRKDMNFLMAWDERIELIDYKDQQKKYGKGSMLVRHMSFPLAFAGFTVLGAVDAIRFVPIEIGLTSHATSYYSLYAPSKFFGFRKENLSSQKAYEMAREFQLSKLIDLEEVKSQGRDNKLQKSNRAELVKLFSMGEFNYIDVKYRNRMKSWYSGITKNIRSRKEKNLIYYEKGSNIFVFERMSLLPIGFGMPEPKKCSRTF